MSKLQLSQNGRLAKYPDLKYYAREEFDGITLYIYKEVPFHGHLGVAVRITHSILTDASNQIVELMIDDAAHKIYAKESEMLGLPEEWNPSCRRVPRSVR